MERTTLTHYVFVTGGVISGLGKGITAASLGAVFRARNYKVSIQKLDVYLNADAGTLNPAEHGECFVTADGAETDLDLGHYERFLDTELTKASSTMSGSLFLKLIEDERAGRYLGKTVQMVPHFTTTIQENIVAAGQGSDIHIVEIGGTVGDIESLAFLEAIREMSIKFAGQCAFAHVVYLPWINTSREFKTKPVQNALRDMRSAGIIPDLTLVRSEGAPPQSQLAKISLFGGVSSESVILLANARTVYEVPITLEAHNAATILLKKFGLKPKKANMQQWHNIVKMATSDYSKTVRIGVVAKYLDNDDTYFSVIEALRAAAWANKTNINIEWVDAEKLETAPDTPLALNAYDGILVPGGFGKRGVEGKIAAATYAMEHKIPYLGICLGMQVAVIAAARRAGVHNATTSEIEPDAQHPAIYIMPSQRGKESTGGSMRLGNYLCVLQKGSLAHKTYGTHWVEERHRHRYEVNQAYNDYYKRANLTLSGLSPDGNLVEVVELAQHPYFIGTQAHPEFRSRPHKPHPLFNGFIGAAIQHAQQNVAARVHSLVQ